ncbi:hypothetical protein ACGFZP_26400 [Kitasatospora sp. NPDC048239]|uniref:hypothetical protein n=1 Tax=Kitasatospora sp. NPDC048239 TaxID=3364046 RepID=UPI003714E3B9
MSVIRFRPDQLGDYTQYGLGQGGQGFVYEVPVPPPGLTGPLVYKEYRAGMLLDPGVLVAMAGFPDTLGPADRAFLLDRLAWPLALAERGSQISGFAMRRVPPEFFIDLAGDARPQGFQFLLNDAAFLQRIGVHLDDEQRLLLLRDLATLLARLHGHGVAVGDLSPNNVLFTLAGAPRCLLIDCDSMSLYGRSAVEQVETPDWEVPEAAKATPASDAAKLGRFVLRLFNGDQHSLDDTRLRALSGELARLAGRSQHADPTARPPAAAWIGPLDQALHTVRTLGPAAAPPQPPPPPGMPPPVAPPADTRPRRRVAPVLVGLLVTAALLVGGDRLVEYYRASSAGSSTASSTASTGPTGSTGSTGTTAAPTGRPAVPTAKPPTAAPTTDHTVPVDTGQVAGHPEATGVATLFSRFFTAVNTRQYDTALGYYDPDTTAIDLDSEQARAEWRRIMSTTQDSNVAIAAITGSGSSTRATVRFRSRQAAGYGPQGHEDQTCTDWQLTYNLSRSGSGYRIISAPGSGVSFRGC